MNEVQLFASVLLILVVGPYTYCNKLLCAILCCENSQEWFSMFILLHNIAWIMKKRDAENYDINVCMLKSRVTSNRHLANVCSKMCLTMTVITDKPHGKQHLYHDSGEHNSAALWFQVQQSIWYIDCSAFLMRLHFYCFSHRKIIPLQKGKRKILMPKMKRLMLSDWICRGRYGQMRREWSYWLSCC